MKHLFLKLFAAIGVLALFFFTVGQAFRQVADYELIARRQFDNKEALEAIAELYARIEADPKHASLKLADERKIENGKVRLIPNQWLPERLSGWRRRAEQIEPQDEMVSRGDVIAYYDANDALIGIEFSRSRYGCFASKDPMRGPPWYDSLHRVQSGPIYVTIRSTG